MFLSFLQLLSPKYLSVFYSIHWQTDHSHLVMAKVMAIKFVAMEAENLEAMMMLIANCSEVI